MKITNYLDSELVNAVLMDDLFEIESLLKQGANPNTFYTVDREHADLPILLGAFITRSSEAAELLIKAGADVNMATSDCENHVLHWLCDNGLSMNYVEQLIAAGADINISNCYGWTPLITAAYADNLDAIQALLRAKADLNSQDHEGKTALIYAIYALNYESVKIIAEAGADLNLKTNNGISPLWLASELGEHDIVELLRSHINKKELETLLTDKGNTLHKNTVLLF